ncbi:MAG: type II toxin-antitoxin system HicA family toxin [Candidatus Izemoplasmatales bacterium]
MPKQITPKQLIKILKKLGFIETRVKGSHHRFSHPDGRKTTIPIHGNEPIGPGLLNKIIKQDLKIEKEEFSELLK